MGRRTRRRRTKQNPVTNLSLKPSWGPTIAAAIITASVTIFAAWLTHHFQLVRLKNNPPILTNSNKAVVSDPSKSSAQAADVVSDSERQRPKPFCGDGIIQWPEQCDDGNKVDGDGCSRDCELEVSRPRCGDGIVQWPEQCDDGNNLDGDGCSQGCQIELGPIYRNGKIVGYKHKKPEIIVNPNWNARRTR